MRCRRKINKGDPVIKIGMLELYHPDCYKEDRVEAYENVGRTNQHYLRESRSHFDALRNLVDSQSVKDSKSFYEVWGKQLVAMDYLDTVLAIAGMYGGLGFFEKTRLSRRSNRYRRTLMGIGSSYREGYLTLRNERRMKELFPSIEEPTIDQLREEESKALDEIKRQVVELYDHLEMFHEDVKKASNRSTIRIRQRIEEQIKEIRKQVQTL